MAVESDPGLAVLSRRRVVRRGEPAIGHRRHRSESPIGPPTTEPDLWDTVGYRGEQGLGRVVRPRVCGLAAHQRPDQSQRLVEPGPSLLERDADRQVIGAAGPRADPAHDRAMRQAREGGQHLGDHDGVTHHWQRDRGGERHVPGRGDDAGQGRRAVEPGPAPDEVIVGGQRRVPQVPGRPGVDAQILACRRSAAQVGQRQVNP
jgi:hypothetical protein